MEDTDTRSTAERVKGAVERLNNALSDLADVESSAESSINDAESNVNSASDSMPEGSYSDRYVLASDVSPEGIEQGVWSDVDAVDSIASNIADTIDLSSVGEEVKSAVGEAIDNAIEEAIGQNLQSAISEALQSFTEDVGSAITANIENALDNADQADFSDAESNISYAQDALSTLHSVLGDGQSMLADVRGALRVLTDAVEQGVELIEAHEEGPNDRYTATVIQAVYGFNIVSDSDGPTLRMLVVPKLDPPQDEQHVLSLGGRKLGRFLREHQISDVSTLVGKDLVIETNAERVGEYPVAVVSQVDGVTETTTANGALHIAAPEFHGIPQGSRVRVLRTDQVGSVVDGDDLYVYVDLDADGMSDRAAYLRDSLEVIG